MLAQFKRNTNIGVGIGVVLQLAGRVLIANGMDFAGDAATLVGTIALIWGCAQYSMGKGYSPWFGALGLLSIFGLIALVLFPDKN